jgi:hypothetical protein
MKKAIIYFLLAGIISSAGIIRADEVSIRKIGEWGTGEYKDVFVLGSYAYCAASGAGLDVFDISDPSNPKMIGSCDTPSSAEGVYCSSTYAYVADSYSGL